jgi:4-hydroxybenzoate polyprenyltransferase
VLLFALAGVLFGVGTLYFVGVGAVALMLAYEQSLVRSDDFSKINAAFFNVNGAISVVFFLVVLAERIAT